MNLDKFTGSGSTPSRRAFWDNAVDAVLSSQKLEGSNASIDEHQGQGSVINFTGQDARQGGGGGGIGACCYNDGTCDDLTEADCTDAGGNWQGPGTTCDDDPNPCVGACCETDGSCVDDSTPDSCEADGGTFQDFGSTCDDVDIDCTTGACCIEGECSILSSDDCATAGGVYQGNGTDCDPNPCAFPPCSCGFDAFDGSGRKFLTRTIIVSGSDDNLVGGNTSCNWTIDGSETATIDPMTCDVSVDRSGSISGSADGPCGTSTLSGSLDEGNCACGGGVLENFYDSGFQYTYDSFLEGCVPHESGGCGAFDICGGFGSGPSEPCSFWDSTTATTATYNSTGSGGGTLEVLGFLSDECMPA